MYDPKYAARLRRCPRCARTLRRTLREWACDVCEIIWRIELARRFKRRDRRRMKVTDDR